MKIRHRPRALATLAASALVLGLAMVVAPTTAAAPNDSGSGRLGDIRHAPPDYGQAKTKLDTTASVTRQFPASGARAVGDVVPWLGRDATQEQFYLKDYALRGIGDKIEVWVATNRAFPTANDCRNQLNLTDVTDGQIRNFIQQFDGAIHPKMSNVFSVAPPRGGADAVLPELAGLPEDTYVGPADKTVVLVDNIRDTNYYDPRDPNGRTYIAGFFSSALNYYFDRNVMTIDAYDWRHRTGANPPDDSGDPAYQACADSLLGSGLGTPDPFAYEGIFAHEYQHLLMSYEDPDETLWMNEGLADYAITLTGYGDPSLPPTNPKLDSHLKCFTGFSDPSFGGPENSLTNWGDQGPPETLCDYGAAWSIMQYFVSHYGRDFMTFLHRDDRNGLPSLDAALDQEGTPRDSRELLHDWAAAMAVDNQIDKNSGVGNGQYQASSLSARINWGNPQSYSSPGAPPNGSDYVRLRGTGGNYLSGGNINRISFQGSTTLEPDPLAWTVDRTPPPTIPDAEQSCGTPLSNGSGAATLYSGCGDDLDRAAVRQVTVPASGATLSFDALWDIEPGWDFGYVQVSTDGGKTYQSLATGSTTSDHNPAAIAAVVANLPGFTGASDGWVKQQVSLNAYAGQRILMAFRYITDPAAAEAGMWVRNVTVGPTNVPTDTVNGWQSATQLQPVPVAGFTVQLVSYNASGGVVKVSRMPLDASFSGTIYSAGIQRFVDPNADVVAALVMYDEPTELVTKQARYSLQVNQAVQPGG